MKRIIALLLAAICVLSFVACGKNGDESMSEEDAEMQALVATEQEARRVLTSFLDSFIKYDFDEAEKYAVGASVLSVERARFYTADNLKEEMLEDGIEAYEGKVEELYNLIFEAAKAASSYKIEGSEGNELEYECTVTLNVPDGTLEDLVYDVIEAPAFEAAMAEAINSGKIGENSSEKEVMDFIFDLTIGIAKDMEIPVKTETKLMVVAKQDDGSWLVKNINKKAAS